MWLGYIEKTFEKDPNGNDISVPIDGSKIGFAYLQTSGAWSGWFDTYAECFAVAPQGSYIITKTVKQICLGRKS